MLKSCEAETIGQEHACTRCSYVWDLNDPEPPQCKTDSELLVERNTRRLAELREVLSCSKQKMGTSSTPTVL